MPGATPIIVFAYKRPDLLRNTLESLALNAPAAQCPLHIHCDGPRTDASAADIEAIRQVRAIAHAAQGFASVEVRAAEVNKGLARSVIDGVTEVIDRHGRAIVVEDDSLLSPHFLRFMIDALDLYEQHERVFSIGAWNYFNGPDGAPENFFIRYPDSQAWATWKRSWDLFDQDGPRLMRRLKQGGLLRKLDADGRVKEYARMLADQVAGRIDSWAIRWTANCILQDKLAFFPATSLVRNVGIGPGATHEAGGHDHNRDLRLADAPVPVRPMEVRETSWALEAWAAYRKSRLHPRPLNPTLKDRFWWALPAGVRRWHQRRRKGRA
ncbi:MAG: hypothetical protein RBT71_09815 [Flavobacteriales bacterium]|jgi:hypothetical protein|nr:hypothetical protein [Flavobacteriales bacterium]